MIKEYTVNTFLEHYSPEKLVSLIDYYIKDLMSNDGYKESEIGEELYFLKVFHIHDTQQKIIGTIMLEAFSVKTEGYIEDLEIVSLKLTEELLPDEFIDRYNTIIKESQNPAQTNKN